MKNLLSEVTTKVTIKKIILPFLLICLSLCACSGDLEPWEMPQVDAAPTAAPAAVPSYSAGTGPEKYVWNEAVSFDISSPGVTGERIQQELSHSKSLLLFGQSLLPDAIFTESRSPYTTRSLQKAQHTVLLDSEGALMENAYVEYVYLPKNGNTKRGITVMAALCTHDTLLQIQRRSLTPHTVFEAGVTPALSSYYLNDFLLFKVGETRYAQAAVLPGSYFSRVAAMEGALEEDEELTLPRQALLSFTCGEDVSDEEFISAVCKIWQYGSGIAPEVPVETPRLPQPGEKGAA